jgi:hypothetical protein
MSKFKAGKYYVGDLCYVVSDDNWMPLLERTDYLSIGEFEYKGMRTYADSTAYGDGTYYDNYGREYGVDAGLIGIMPIEAIDNESNGGNIIEFENDFEVWSEEGLFRFGNITIDTKGEDEYDEEYYDDYEENDDEEDEEDIEE